MNEFCLNSADVPTSTSTYSSHIEAIEDASDHLGKIALRQHLLLESLLRNAENEQAVRDYIFEAIRISTQKAIQSLAEKITGFSSEISEYTNGAELRTSLPPALYQNFQLLEECKLSPALESRIKKFSYEEEGWFDGGGLSLNPVCLRNFLTFWKAVANTSVEPDIFLSPNGTIQAEWYRNKNKSLVIEFKRDCFLVILTDGNNRYQAKEEEQESLINLLIRRPSKPLSWKPNV